MLQSLFPLRVISGASLCSSSLTYLSRLPIFSFSSRRMHRGGRSGGRGRGLGNTASSRDSHSTSSSSQQGGGWGRGITAPSRYSHPTNSSSRQEADHHRDEISRARKEEDHKSNGTGASSMHNNLNFPVLSGGSSGKGKSHHIGSSKPQIPTSHDTKIGHDRSSQVAQYFSESVAKQENSPKYGARDSTLGSGGPKNARHLPNNSNNLQNLKQGASSRDSHSTSSSSQQGGGWGRGITAPSRYSHPTNSSSRQEADHHRDEISRARKEEDHKSNGTGASSMHNNLQHQQKGSSTLDINDFPVLSGGSSGKGKSHHIGSSIPQISTSHDTKIGHDKSSQVAKQKNSPKYGASDSTLGSGGPTNARHLPNNSNNLQNLNQGASDQSNPQASFSTWSGSGDEFTNSRTPQPGGYSPERADTEFDHEKNQQVAQCFSPSMAKQENSPKFGAEDSSFSFGRPTNARHLPNISMSSNSPQNLNQVASHHSSLEASYSTWSGSGDKISKSRTPQPGRTSPKRAECADDKPVVPPFDIRPVKTGSFQLNPPLHTKNKERREHEKKRNNNQILRSGMVLLKNYLTEAEQVKIVRECRELGLKPGGFYQPGYKDGAKLHLHMMCLGKEWDPETRLYQEQRSVDGAKPPPIPNVFSELVSKAIKSSHSLIKENHKSSNPERELPCMEPDLCIVNFYSRTGKLGLHQDRDESSESLKNGLPVVSFSLGETAVFLYGDERDADKADKVQLESGDVLIFGGKSRHVFHGVPSIIPNSAPGFLAKHLRPGRLNLTFRKY